MRRLFAPVAILGVFVSTTVAFGQTQKAGDASAAITKVERAWESAMRAKDGAAVDKILATNWIGLNPDASTSTHAEFVKAVNAGDYATVKLDDVKVRMAGAAAIAYGTASDKDGKYAYTDVFVQESGTWRAVYSQLALVPPAAKK